MRNRSFVQAYSQTPWRRQMQTIGIVVVAIVSLGLLAILYLNVTARTATMGRQVQGLQNERIRLQQHIESLESQLASLSSNEAMQARATASGFAPVQPGAVTYLMVEGYRGRTSVELAPRAGGQFTGVVRLPAEYTKSLFDWVGEVLDEYAFGLLGGY